MWTSGGHYGGNVRALAIDPTTPATLYAGTEVGVYKSTDSGGSWAAAHTGIFDAGGGLVTALAINPATPSTLYAGTWQYGGVSKSTDSGGTWAAANTGLTTQYVTALAINPATPSTLYAGTYDGGVFKSTNSGGTWAAATTGLTNLYVQALAINPATPATIYAGTYDGGVFKSTNSGDTWAAANTGLTSLNVSALAVNPTNPTTLYAGTYGGGVLKSTDSGGTWAVANTGLTAKAVAALAISPTGATLYAGTYAGGVFKSTDSGGTWAAAMTGLTCLDVAALAVNPSTPATLYAGASFGIFKSTNSGGNWATANTGLTTEYVKALAINPATPSTLYAGTYSGGVFKSTNSGGTWAAANTVLTTDTVTALVINPTTPSTLYAGTYYPWTYEGGVFKSTDSGGTWVAANSGLPNVAVDAMAIDPTGAATLYAGLTYGSMWQLNVGDSPAPPAIISQPASQTVTVGGTANFGVTAVGTTPLSYQWRLGGTNLNSAIGSSLVLANVQLTNAGYYTVVVSNVTGSVTSTPALLDVRYTLAYGNGELMLGSNYTFIGSVDLEFWSVFPNANIFYTLDGSEPSFASSYYSGPFSLNRTASLRVVAYSADFLQAAESPPIYLTIIPVYALHLISPGGGNVAVSPPTGPYARNTIVTLTPQPSNGWTFLEWRGDASGTNPTGVLTMDREKTVQAIFGTTLGTTVAGNGSVQVYPALPLYPYGTVARLAAIPQPGNFFGVWGNAASGNTNPLYFAVTGANPVVASVFGALAANHYALNVIPDGFGKVTATPQGNFYVAGASVPLDAIPGPGQQFLGWSGDATGTQNPLPVAMNASKTITATFTRKPSLAIAAPLNGLFADGFRATLSGEFGQAYRIDASTNLVDWPPLATITNIYGTTQFTDEVATNAPRRFYRALQE